MELEPLIEKYFDDVIQTQRRTRYDIQDLITFSLLAAFTIQPVSTDTFTLTNGLAHILNQQLLIMSRLNLHPATIEFDPPGGTVGKKGRITFFHIIPQQLQFFMERRSSPPTPHYIHTLCNYARQCIEVVQFIPLRTDDIYRGVTLELIVAEAQQLLDYM